MNGGAVMPREQGWAGVRSIGERAGDGVEIGVAARLVGTERFWDLGGERAFPAASTIKLAVLVALAREMDAGRLALDHERRVEPSAKVPGSGVLTWMRHGLTLSLGDLAYLMIAVSDNTASNLLIDAVGTERMADAVTELGLGGTALNRRFLGRATRSGAPENVTRAADLVVLLGAIAAGQAASSERCAWMRGVLELQQHRDRLARRLPEGYAFGGKSGSLPGIAHDAGLITGPGGTLAIAVLTRGIGDGYEADVLIGEIGAAMAGAGW